MSLVEGATGNPEANSLAAACKLSAASVSPPHLEEPSLALCAGDERDAASTHWMTGSRFAWARGELLGCGYDKLRGRQFDLVINGTSASLAGDMPQLPDRLLAPGAVCYDMMYAPEATVFMRWARARGARASADGLGMLIEQAAESFYIWRGCRPETGALIAEIRRQISR